MGLGTQAKGRGQSGGTRGRVALFALGATVALLIAAPAANASFHLMKVREVYPAGDASYVELQMTSAGEYLVASHPLLSCNADCSVSNEFSLPSNVSISSPNNATILIADSGYASAFPSGPARDEEDTNLNLDPAGGAVCWTDGSPPDCVSWGNFTGPLPTHVPAYVVGSPASPGGVTAGKALRRSIASGCSTFLEQAGDTDDTDNSAADFSEQTPNPRHNASPVTEMMCVAPMPPTTTIDTKPANPTKTTSAAFTYHSSPAGATFECKLDAAAFASCEASGKSYPGPLLEGIHTFQVRATDGNGTGPAASATWTIDLTPPTTTIDTKPADPSPGASAAFKFHASEASTFQCSLEGPVTKPLATCSSPKTYTALTDGEYTFRVQATDQAGNVQASPTPYSWTVKNSVPDTTPPLTSITSHPPDPSESPSAAFAYESNEPGSTFECRLDGGAFVACAPTGTTYNGLPPGPHAFEVQAKDPSGNVDPSPAGFSFTVVGSGPYEEPPPITPDTKITIKPPAKTHDRTPTIKFKATAAGASYQCKLDGKPFKPCRSPFTTKTLSFGRHTLKIKASVGGIADPSPATVSFKVVRG